MTSILIVDDDASIREVVRFALERAGFAVIEAAGGSAALALADPLPDLVVLDVMMPDMDGIEVCRALRQRSKIPILFLSSRDDEIDRVVGLEVGGDDYLSKPFSPRELIARVKAILRRVTPDPAPAPAASTLLRHGRLSLDTERVLAGWNGQEISLTATEFGMLRTLLRQPGKVFSRDALMDGAYAVERIVSDRTIDSHIRRLRGKFSTVGANPIETLPGFGYRLGDCA